MTRLIAAAALVWLAAPLTAAEPPKLGKTTEIEFTDASPRYGTYRYYEFDLPLEQGDRFRFQVEPVGGVKMSLSVFADKYVGAVVAEFERSPGGLDGARKVDWTMKDAPPGKKVRIRVYSADTGKVNLRVSKVGDDADPQSDEIKKLKAENAELRKQLEDQKRQIEEIRRALEKKNKM